MEQKKIVKEYGLFMVLKPSDFEDDWNRYGKRYDRKAMRSYLINEANNINFVLKELSDDDMVYVNDCIKASMNTRKRRASE